MKQLRVTANRRYLEFDDGTPFFYMGDTAWELFHRLDRDEALQYLDTRAEQQFNVIQAVVLSELEGLTTPNRYGEYVLHDMDPSRPNERYFEHIDFVVEEAAKRNMFIGMLPTWGDKVHIKWAGGPEILTSETAGGFGEWLGRRYTDQPIIWILGGDRPVEAERHLLAWRALAKGLRCGDGGSHLITYHPMGDDSSAHYVHYEKWLDFNTIQSGHGRWHRHNHLMIENDRKMWPFKPILDAEPAYEDHPGMTDVPEPDVCYFDDAYIRRKAWHSVIAGSCGHTYGCHPVWQMYAPPFEPLNRVRRTWKEALRLPGAEQMRYLRSFMESLPFTTLQPESGLFFGDPGNCEYMIRGMVAGDGSCAVIYLPRPRAVRLNEKKLPQPQMHATWYDPSNGQRSDAGTVDASAELVPPADDHDWVLLLTAE